MEKAKDAFKTEYRCRCGNPLAIVEDKQTTLFGCDRCDCYIILLPWQLREFRRKNYFDWKGLMKYAYNTYLEARRFVCK